MDLGSMYVEHSHIHRIQLRRGLQVGYAGSIRYNFLLALGPPLQYIIKVINNMKATRKEMIKNRSATNKNPKLNNRNVFAS